MNNVFSIDVEMDVRATGTVKVVAASLDEALAKLSPEFVSRNFKLNDVDSIDAEGASDIWLESYRAAGGVYGVVQKPLPGSDAPDSTAGS